MVFTCLIVEQVKVTESWPISVKNLTAILAHTCHLSAKETERLRGPKATHLAFADLGPVPRLPSCSSRCLLRLEGKGSL